MNRASIATPLGWIAITEADEAIIAIDWTEPGPAPETALACRAADQIAEYFAGDLRQFDLPLRPSGGDLQQAVCKRMSQIPYGETVTYGDIARELNVPAQAIGQACGGNSIPIVIPCHRVVGADGLGGFSARGGVETKVALLRHEGAYSLLI